MSGITIQAPVTFTEENLNDLYVTALEGGIQYWAADEGYTWNMDNYGLDYRATVRLHDEPEREPLTINRDTIVRGLTLLSTSGGYGSHWQDVVNDNVDADTADVVVQFGLFGEVIYV